MQRPLLCLVALALAASTSLPAHATGLVTRGINVASGPIGTVAGIGLAFMDEFRRADRCLSNGEAAAEASGRSGAVAGALGATVGGVLGAAMGGTGGSIAKGAVGGLTIGGLLGSAGANGVAGSLMAGGRDLERQRTIDLCHLVATANDLGAPVWLDLANRVGPACSVDPQRIFRGDARVDEYVLNQCVRRNAQLTSIARERLNVLRNINYATCLSGQYIVAEYDRQMVEQAQRSGGSAMPTAMPSCTGAGLSGQYSWLIR